jgi:hypothetical protein
MWISVPPASMNPVAHGVDMQPAVPVVALVVRDAAGSPVRQVIRIRTAVQAAAEAPGSWRWPS